MIPIGGSPAGLISDAAGPSVKRIGVDALDRLEDHLAATPLASAFDSSIHGDVEVESETEKAKKEEEAKFRRWMAGGVTNKMEIEEKEKGVVIYRQDRRDKVTMEASSFGHTPLFPSWSKTPNPGTIVNQAGASGYHEGLRFRWSPSTNAGRCAHTHTHTNCCMTRDLSHAVPPFNALPSCDVPPIQQRVHRLAAGLDIRPPIPCASNREPSPWLHTLETHTQTHKSPRHMTGQSSAVRDCTLDMLPD